MSITFETLGLSAPILKALKAQGYETPTPIQQQAIPHVRAGRDLVGLAQTGTGKTAAFALPIIERLAADRKHAGPKACRTLVLAPTRELASQIAESFRIYGQFIGLSCTVVFGGVPIGRQFKAMERGVDVLVATPGRLIDLIEQRGCRLDGVEVLVLDEADHMLDLGFIHSLRKIARLVPKQRQTVFFSATMPAPIAELASAFLTDPVQVAVTPVSSTAERVSQAVIHVENADKQDVLHDLLKNEAISRALVFTRTKHGADRVVKRLEAVGIEAQAIHGNKSQPQRERALEAFKKGRARLLVATEIAARGIDVDEVTHVINFDLPDVPEQYVHRIGRTARAGHDGQAISFCAPDERICLRDIERLTKQEVPIIQHKLSLAPPKPGERLLPRPAPGGRQPRQGQGQRDPRPQGQRAPQTTQARADSHRQNPHKAHAPKPRGERAEHAPHHRDAHRDAPRDGGRETGDRRDRKGNEVWSNSGPARAPAKRRPPR